METFDTDKSGTLEDPLPSPFTEHDKSMMAMFAVLGVRVDVLHGAKLQVQMSREGQGPGDGAGQRRSVQREGALLVPLLPAAVQSDKPHTSLARAESVPVCRFAPGVPAVGASISNELSHELTISDSGPLMGRFGPCDLPSHNPCPSRAMLMPRCSGGWLDQPPLIGIRR